MALTPRPFWNLTELTLADDDTNPIPTDNANRAIKGNVATQVMQPGGQLCKQWRNLGKAQVLGPLCLWQCFWWCFITNVWSVDHIIIVIYINGVCYGGVLWNVLNWRAVVTLFKASGTTMVCAALTTLSPNLQALSCRVTVSFQFWNNQLSSGIKYQRKAYLIVYILWQRTNKLGFIQSV